MSDFFALEAGEYLDRLDALLQPPAPPAADELVRLARALRGSALMASQAGIARAAMGLEALARGVREGRRPWDDATQQLMTRAIDDLKIFVRKAASWTDGDTAKAEALASQLEQAGGRPSGQVRAAEAMGLDAGARAFVAREGAAIASALDRAGRALRSNPTAPDPLHQVLKALQPLRGLAALADLPPLPDLLEGIEQALGEISRVRTTPPPGLGDTIAELFQMAATSIAHAAREVAEHGRPDPESAEFRKFAGLLVQFMDSEPEVVPIETVATIVRRGTPPHGEGSGDSPRPQSFGRLELVSHGEHLRQAADSLERAPSATQRELRAHTLAGTFRALASGGGGPVAERVAEFAQAAREAVTSGLAVSQPVLFAAELRKAGAILAASGSGDDTATVAALAAVTLAVRRLGGAAVAVPPQPPPTVSAPPRPPATPPEPPLGAEATTDLAGTWMKYQQLVSAGVGPASLDELLKGGAAAGPAPTARVNGGEPVDIRTLLYKGARARARAQELREAAKRANSDALRAIIDEVCDLVVLAIEPE
jgi:chemotaxis protein histidine kinase CheA